MASVKYGLVAKLLSGIFVFSWIAMGSLHAEESSYRVVATYKVSGTGRIAALAVDTTGNRLYLARGNSVAVLNAGSGATLGTIEAAPGVSGVALASDFNRGFTSNSAGDSITIFDTRSLKTIATVKSPGGSPTAIDYDSESRRVFVSNSSGSVTVLDAASGAVVGTIKLGGKPGQLISNNYGQLFVLDTGGNTVHVIDTKLLKNLGSFPAGTGENCSGLALDPVGRRLFVACGNHDLAVIDTDIGFAFQELPIGSGLAGDAFTFSPTGAGGWKGAIFVASSDGTLSILQMNAFIRYLPGFTMKLPPGIHSVVFDPKTHRLFVPAPAGNHGAWQVLVVAK